MEVCRIAKGESGSIGGNREQSCWKQSGLEVRHTGLARGRAAFATKAFRCGDVILEEVPFLVVESFNELGAQWSEDLSAFCDAPADVREQVLALFPDNVSSGHRLARLASSFVATVKDEDVPVEDVEKALLAFQLTGYQLEGKDDLMGLFPLVTKINHSCIPNARGALRPPRTPSYVYALRDIAIGEEITMCYLSTFEQLKHADSRKRHLQSQNMFRCDCPLCSSGGDTLRKIPCPKCHPRIDAQLPVDIAREEGPVSYAQLSFTDSSWSCPTCLEGWAYGDFFRACQCELSDEERIAASVSKYVTSLGDNCFYDSVDNIELHSLKQDTNAKFGSRHWTSIHLDICRIDHITTQLQQCVLVGVHKHRPVPQAVRASLIELDCRVNFVLERLRSALCHERNVFPLLWERVWNAGTLLCIFEVFDVALKLLLCIEPFVIACSQQILSVPDTGITPSQGLDFLQHQIQTCRARAISLSVELSPIFCQSTYYKLTVSGGLSQAKLEYYKEIAERLVENQQYQQALLLYNGLRSSLMSVEDEHARQELEHALYSRTAACVMFMSMAKSFENT